MSTLFAIFANNSNPDSNVHEIKVYWEAESPATPFRINIAGFGDFSGIHQRRYSVEGLEDIIGSLTHDWDYTPELFPRGKVCNLTQHKLTDEQVLDLYRRGFDATDIREQTDMAETFYTLPSHEEMVMKAERTADWAKGLGFQAAVMGGAPYYMPYLEGALEFHGIRPIYAFTQRKVIEIPQEDGTVVKQSAFSHAGWVGL